MTTLVSNFAPAAQMNWPRIGALSGSLSMHLYVLALLLAPPVAMVLLRHAEPEPIVAHFIQIPIKTQPKSEPSLPTPTRHETHHVAPVTHATAPLTDTLGPIIPTIAVDLDSRLDVSPPDTSAEVAPTALAYGKRTQVPYPKDASRRREQGTVILRVLVGADGIPQTVEIESSSGSPRLDSAARDAVMHWSFRPGTRGGTAQSAWARVPIAFDLSTL